MTTLVWVPKVVAARQEIYDCIEVDKPLAAIKLDEFDFPQSESSSRLSGARASWGECKKCVNS